MVPLASTELPFTFNHFPFLTVGACPLAFMLKYPKINVK